MLFKYVGVEGEVDESDRKKFFSRHYGDNYVTVSRFE